MSDGYDREEDRMERLDERVELLESLDLAALDGRIADLENRVTQLETPNQPNPVATVTVTINTTRSPTSMAFQILDSDHTKIASVTYLDAAGVPTTDAGATVAFASSDPTVVTVDPTSGAIAPATPVKLGVAQVQATVTNTDGTTVTGVPADVELIAGAAATFTVGVA